MMMVWVQPSLHSGKDGRCSRANGCAETCFDWGKFMNWASIENRGKIDERSTMAYLKRQRRILTHHLPVPLPSLLLLLCHSLSTFLLSTLLCSPLSICLRTHCYGNDTQGGLGGDQGDHSDDFRQISSVAHTFSENLRAKKESECACSCLFTILYLHCSCTACLREKNTNAVHHRHKNVLNQPEKATQ